MNQKPERLNNQALLRTLGRISKKTGVKPVSVGSILRDTRRLDVPVGTILAAKEEREKRAAKSSVTEPTEVA